MRIPINSLRKCRRYRRIMVGSRDARSNTLARARGARRSSGCTRKSLNVLYLQAKRPGPLNLGAEESAELGSSSYTNKRVEGLLLRCMGKVLLAGAAVPPPFSSTPRHVWLVFSQEANDLMERLTFSAPRQRYTRTTGARLGLTQ